MDAKIVLFGHPNVGKSVLFNQLTGLTAIVSNYPGTTVEVYEGEARVGGFRLRILDAPGAYSLSATNEAEDVARRLLLEGKPDIVVQVADATSLRRHLYLTLELMELGLPLILVLNQVDRAERAGIKIDEEGLERALGIPVVLTAAVEGRGIRDLLKTIIDVLRSGRAPSPPRLPPEIEDRLAKLEDRLSDKLPPELRRFARALASLAALSDEKFSYLTEDMPGELGGYLEELGRDLALARAELANAIYERVVASRGRALKPSVFDRLLVRPAAGLITASLIMLAVIWSTLGVIHEIGHRLPSTLYYGFYEPIVRGGLEAALPDGLIKYILIGDSPGIYSSLGLLTTGVFFVFFMILPCLFVLYLVLGVLEDSGLLPRLAVPFDAPLRKVGACGEAMCPMVAGSGCSIVGVFATRILKTEKARFIASFIQWIGIPCMAEQVMIWLVLGRYSPTYVALLYAILLATTIITALILNVLLPGSEEPLIMELPPWRRPQLRNVLKKTIVRLREFLLKGTPLVLMGVLVVNLLYYTGLIGALAGLLAPVVSGLFNLPGHVAASLVIGVLRKDVAVGVLRAVAPGMTALQMLTAVTVVTLYFPCMGSLVVTLKELGLKRTLLMIVIMTIITLVVGSLLGFLSRLYPG